MTASLLLLLLVSACTAELGFKPKRQYTYQYEAKQASGIPGLQSQWSAFGMKMIVKIQVPTSSNLYFKLESVQQGELKNVDTHQQWRDNFSMPYSPIQRNAQELGKVFKVELNGGVVRKVITTQGEPIWVVNIKKSIAQMFQLDLQRHQATDMPSMAQPSSYQSGDQPDFFRVMEDSIGGECETLYETTTHLPDNIKADMLEELTIISQSSIPGIEVPKFDQFQPFVVTKTKNYQNCKTRPNWQHMTPGAVSCRSTDCYLTASNRSASARYVLDGDRSSFKIQSVLAESEALMFPYGHETEQLWTVTNQTLFLQQDTTMGSFFGEPKPPKSYDELTFQYPTADGDDLKMPGLKSAPQLSTHLPGAPVKLIHSQLSQDQLVSLVKSIIQKVDQFLNKVPDPVQEDVAGYVVEIERAFSWLSYDKLEQVYEGLTSQGQKDIFWDTLALTGTNPAVMKILDGIKTGQIVKTQMASIIATLPINIKTPTYELVNKLFHLYQSNRIQSQKPQRMTMALSLGNIFYQVCISNTTVEHSYTQGLYQKQHFCSSQFKALLKEHFIPFLEEKIEKTEEPEKLAYIQALGNVGDQQIIKVLSKLVADQKSPPLVVSKAIYAFYRVVAQYPEKVRNVASPIFHDVSRPTDVRLAAVSMLLTSNPPITYWQKIATSTWFEPSNAVVALIHSTYSTMANITMAHVQPLFEMSRHARITLPLVRPPQGGFAFSGSYNYRNGQIIPQYQVAALTQLSVIASKTSLIPSAIYMDFQHYINSILYSNHRWTLNVQGGQKIIDDFMGVGSTSSRRRQSPRDLSTGLQQLDSIMRSLNQQEPEKFQATLYTQLMGAMDAFFVYDEDRYTEMMNKIRQGDSWTRNQMQKIVYLEDTTVTFASEIGMPVIYSKKMPMVASARGEMNVKWSSNEGTYTVTMQKVQWVVAVKSLVMVSTVSPFSLRTLGAGVENKVQLSLPMSLKAKFDAQARKLQVEVEIVQQPSPVKLAHIQTIPFTTAVNVNKYENLVTSSDTKEITTSHQTDIKVPFGKAFGVNGHLRLVSDNPIMNFGTFWTELKKRGTTGIAHFWLMMGSLRSRHYDIVIDTASSTSQKFQVTLASVSSDKQMSQPIITNQQHISQVNSCIDETKQLMQGKQWEVPQVSQQQRLPMDSKAGYVAVGTITQKSGTMLHYKAQLALVSDAQWYNQKLSLRAVLPSNKVCLDTVMAFPTLSDIREKLLNSNIEAPVWAKLSYGSDCRQHNLNMIGSVRRDEMAKEYAKSSCPEALRCIQHEKRGNPNSADCRIAKDHAALANYYEFNFTEDNLTPNFRNTSYSLDFFVKYVLWPYMSNDPYAKNPSNKVNIKIQLNPNKNGMSLHISKPFETTNYEDVQLPFNMMYEPGLLTMRKSISKKISDSLHGVDKTVCLVDQLMVKTFDNVTLERKPSNSWTMLTWDSSTTRNLAIFEKVVNQKSVARILVDDKVIEIDSSNLQRVMVGGKPQTLSPAKPVIVRDTDDEKIIAKVLMLTDDTVKVVLLEHYTKLLVTKEGVQIHTTMLAYRNRMRGLCGDFNGEEQDDLVGLNGCIYKKGQEFYEACHFPLENPSQFRPRQPVPCIRRPAQANQSHGVSSTVRRH